MRGADAANEDIQRHDLAVHHSAPFGSARMLDIAVHVPLDVGNAEIAHERVDPLEQVIANLGPGQVERQLVAGIDWRGALDTEHPVGMRAVEVAVGIDHLRLEPQSEFHAQAADMVRKRLETIGIDLFRDVPVA